MEVRRGDIVAIAIPGDYGKPRPALVIQHDAFGDLESLVVLRITSAVHELPLFRISIEPSAANGLRKPSQVMIDKPAAVPKGKVGQRIGHLDSDTLREVSLSVRRFLDLG